MRLRHIAASANQTFSFEGLTMTRLVIAGIVLLALATAAHADRVTADRCAAKLPPISKILYDRSLPEVLAGKTLVDSLTSTARSMVFGGELAVSDARPAAEAAASCLEQARS
jgi:hypothetical protein